MEYLDRGAWRWGIVSVIFIILRKVFFFARWRNGGTSGKALATVTGGRRGAGHGLCTVTGGGERADFCLFVCWFGKFVVPLRCKYFNH